MARPTASRRAAQAISIHINSRAQIPFAASTGACTLVGNLGLADYAAGVTDYNTGLAGLLSETAPVPRKCQATTFLPTPDRTINARNHATLEVTRMTCGSPACIQSKHSFKFGVDIAHSNDLSENLRFQFGSYSYTNLGNYLSDLLSPNKCASGHATACFSSYQQAFGPLGFQFNTNDVAFFAE